MSRLDAEATRGSNRRLQFGDGLPGRENLHASAEVPPGPDNRVRQREAAFSGNTQERQMCRTRTWAGVMGCSVPCRAECERVVLPVASDRPFALNAVKQAESLRAECEEWQPEEVCLGANDPGQLWE